MIPFRLTPQQFSDRYARNLEKISKQAIAALRGHLGMVVEAGVDMAEVQIFAGDDDPHQPTVWIYYQGKDNKVDATDLSLHAGRSLALDLGLERVEEFDPRFFTDEKFAGLDIAANALKRWFAECWWKAGGWNYLTPVTLQVHDGHGDRNAVRLTEK